MAVAKRPIADIAQELIRRNAPANADSEAVERLAEKVARRVHGEDPNPAEVVDELLQERSQETQEQRAGQADQGRYVPDTLEALTEQIEALTERISTSEEPSRGAGPSGGPRR